MIIVCNIYSEHYVWYGTNDNRQMKDICDIGFDNIDDKLFTISSEYYVNNVSAHTKFGSDQYQISETQSKQYHYLFLCRTFSDFDELSDRIITVDNHQEVYPQFLVKFKMTSIQQNVNHNDNHSHTEEVRLSPNNSKYTESSLSAKEVEVQVETETETEIPAQVGSLVMILMDKFITNNFTQETQVEKPLAMQLGSISGFVSDEPQEPTISEIEDRNLIQRQMNISRTLIIIQSMIMMLKRNRYSFKNHYFLHGLVKFGMNYQELIYVFCIAICQYEAIELN